ncbi:DUF7146 domain-containing protein [Marinivivus vitaminiproducens]|uniref:DUF7146 domain-containing protein n=1 Tax=Marinivivus vitaminiproducens TaxID=3035935 RepID=UPI00279FB744|nr:toprim domain-containing protein [Geminicoccaceae bacterium SCSIO 64248]
MSRHDASRLARALGREAEAVCRHYLPNGRRQGAYWQVGDVRGTPGRSMYVRLTDSPGRVAGKWTDAASGEHGDLLDVIREALGLADFAEAAREARTFLRLPHDRPEPEAHRPSVSSAAPGSVEAARRLLAMTQPIGGTPVATYLRARGITNLHGTESLRFHPRCYRRPEDGGPTETWPAMIAAVTDPGGRVTGAHRTWLARDGSAKAPLPEPRKAMGQLLGNAVRLGRPDHVLAAGEGIETCLSLRELLPDMAIAAALSAAHLAALNLPDSLRRLYIVRDNDSAGDGARDRLIERAQAAGIETAVLSPRLGDLNEDLQALGPDVLHRHLRLQLVGDDVTRYLARAA